MPSYEIRTIANHLGFPEGPLVMSDGTIYVCDIKGGRILKVSEGQTSVFADVGGGPNGLAVGPDGALYVANNGGAMRWRQVGRQIISDGFEEAGFDTRVERVDFSSGRVTRLLDNLNGRPFQAIDDLVFDNSEGFWFSDLGRDGERSRTYGGVYWSSVDGRTAREAAYPLHMGANGIGLSPNGKTLYATEYGAGRLWSWEIEGPGVLRKSGTQAHGGTLLWQASNAELLDSLKVTTSGNIVIATQPSGVFSVISPTGQLLEAIQMPEPFPTNLCFDPVDPAIAYATLSRTGRLVRIERS